MSRILDLLLPTPCVICDKLGAPLCITCKLNFQTSVIPIEISGVTGFGISEYTAHAALLVNAIKEKGLTSLIPPVADLVVQHWPNNLMKAVLVPLPSSPANSKKRGFSHTALMARALTKRLPRATQRDLLRSARSRQDQVGLDAHERSQNLEGAFKADLRGFMAVTSTIVLIDDVLTSGASMSAAIQTLRAAGLNVAGFCVVARAGVK